MAHRSSTDVADTGDGDVRLVAIPFIQYAIAGMADPEAHNREVERRWAEVGVEPYRPCEQRVRPIRRVRRHWGRAPRERSNHRRRGSRRATGTGSRAGPDDPDEADSHLTPASLGEAL
jgi:hypothetical protein